MKKRTIITGVLIALFFALAIWGYNTLSGVFMAPSSAPQNSKPVKAPDFAVYTLDGEQVRLSDSLGENIVVNFWATWCPPCKAELPDFQKAYEKYSDFAEFMMINLNDQKDETSEKVKAFKEENGYTFPVYMDSDHSAAFAYGVRSVPMTLFINEKGEIIKGHMGMIDKRGLFEGIDMLLK